MDNRESRMKDLAGMVVAKWQKENTGTRLHLEQYNLEGLALLMASHMRKLSSDENFEPPEHFRTEMLDEIFQTIWKSGLVSPVHAKVIGEQEKKDAEEAARKAALKAEVDAEVALELFVARLEAQGGQRAVSEWLQNKASKEQKELFSRLYPSGAVTPEALPQQQAPTFIIKTTDRKSGRVKFVSSDDPHRRISLHPNLENAAKFGETSRKNFADRLFRERGDELEIEVIEV